MQLVVMDLHRQRNPARPALLGVQRYSCELHQRLSAKAKLDMPIDRTSTMRLMALVGGALFVTICLRVPVASGGGPLRFVLLSLAILLPATLALVRYSGRDSWFIVPLVVIGVVVGIMIDVALDTKEDRNLFPIEIVVACALVTPAVVTGAALGWFLKRKVARAGPAENRENPLQDGQRQ